MESNLRQTTQQIKVTQPTSFYISFLFLNLQNLILPISIRDYRHNNEFSVTIYEISYVRTARVSFGIRKKKYQKRPTLQAKIFCLFPQKSYAQKRYDHVPARLRAYKRNFYCKTRSKVLCQPTTAVISPSSEARYCMFRAAALRLSISPHRTRHSY